MFKRHAAPKLLSLFLIALASMTLLMTSPAGGRGQSKGGAKKATSKAASAGATERETGVILSSDGKRATIKRGFTAKKIAPNEVIVTGTLAGKIIKQTVRCNCVKVDRTKPGSSCDTKPVDAFTFVCEAFGGCACELKLENVPMPLSPEIAKRLGGRSTTIARGEYAFSAGKALLNVEVAK